jgi:transcriptional regulator with XRE-family HTH domain
MAATVGELLAKARKESGLSQRQLGAKTGMSDAAICQMESGIIREPSFAKVVRLAETLNLPLEKLARAAIAHDRR